MAAFQPVMSVEEMEAFFVEAFPQRGSQTRVTEIAPGRARVVLDPVDANLRPGNLVSGPTQMGLADHAAYAVILAHIGPVAMAVTSNLNFSFLRGVQMRQVVADARLLKLGRRLATVDVVLWQDDESNLVAQSTVTYAIPG
ncbi:PaaI family thioesterase [Novosphingobium sp.]|uniref:PaaI family thioesterase n=1 Tax=Novosphingobium sp. TaxID=1874826 RepID=UPI0025EB662A|nr:PaaI family thioesterase [Novosphingobium sp.]MCC6924366.1 PaaI family thioesterase [Novosphingobium sp.]